MVPYNPKNWFTLIFQIHKSHLMRYMAPNLVGIGLLSGLMTWFFTDYAHLSIPPGLNIHAFVGIVLGLVLVFRTNTAYERWWEGRKLFGALTNHSRNLALKLNAFLPENAIEERQFFNDAIGDFYFALKNHLREVRKPEELRLENQPYRKDYGMVKHVPNLIAAHLQQRITKMMSEGTINNDQYRVMNDDVSAFIDVLGATERIQKTPIPFSYSIYIKKVIIVYLLSLPLSTITSLGYYTVPMVMFTTYVIAGIELLAEEIEDPFGHDHNDLDTDGMAENIRKNLDEILMGDMSFEKDDPKPELVGPKYP